MKDKLYIITFLTILYVIMISFFILPKEEISFTEKRYLKKLPEFSMTSSYGNNLEAYLLDHFPKRDFWRGLHSYYNYFVMQKRENNDLVLFKDKIFKTSKTNKKAIEYYFKYIENMKQLAKPHQNMYYVLVPDKNYYVKDIPLLKMDYDFLYQHKVDGVVSIDIRDQLSIDNYYGTDTHWKQETLEDVVAYILRNMNIEPQKIDYEVNRFENFKGVYYGEVAINFKKDTLYYLTNEDILNAKVTYLENKKLTTVYNKENLDSFDSYELFLDGASAYIEIENNHSRTERELVVFRDSFGSSIIPLFIPYFKKITVVDNRYISSSIFKDLVNFETQDILFLNSTLLANESFALKN